MLPRLAALVNGWVCLGFTSYSICRGRTIACRWMALSIACTPRTASGEKYDVVATGRPGAAVEIQIRTVRWTNGIMRKLRPLYPQDAALSDPYNVPGDCA